jgi:site-specific DNA recombinase
MQHKVGAYCRVSTEEQAQVIEGSLDSQRHRLNAFVELKNMQESGRWGKIVDFYVDEGFSAKDTRRPALQKLLSDMRAGKINLILVTDLSRLSRNILDFCLLLNDLREHGGKFLSVKEQFDTTTAAGHMMVMNMINLAQFEREQVAERVAQNFFSRAQRGLLNGGPVILGYDKNPDRSSEYVVNEQEAPLVRDVFRFFLEEGSLARTTRRLNESGIPRKIGIDRKLRLASEGIWSIMSLRNLLENKAYIGIREVNKKYKDKEQNSLMPWQRYQETKATWPAIVPVETFEKVQYALTMGRKLERPKTHHTNGSPFLLTGRLRCSECGAPFVGETGHGRTTSVRYYGHKQYQGIPFRCSVRRFPADPAEEAIEKHLADIALNPNGLEKVEVAIFEDIDMETADVRKDKERVRIRLLEIEKESHAIFRALSDMTDTAGLALVKEKIASLGTEKSALSARFQEIEGRLQQSDRKKVAMERIETRAQEFKAGWRKGTLAQKKRLIRGLIEEIQVRPGVFDLYFLVHEDDPAIDPKAKVLRPSFTPQKTFAESADAQNKKAVGNSVIPTAFFDVDVKNGVADGT